MSNPSIQDLTKLVLFSGRLSEIHIKNLKSFPFYFFNGLKEAEIIHNISTKKEDGPSLIEYKLKIEGDNDHLPIRYKKLEEAVRSIFWKEMVVKIVVNDVEVYKSE